MDPVEELREDMMEFMKVHDLNFLPHTKTSDMITPGKAKRILDHCKPKGKSLESPLPASSFNKLDAFAAGEANTIFAILVKINRPQLIQQFFSAEPRLSNDVLPISYRLGQGQIKVESKNKGELKKPFSIPPWTKSAIGEFCDNQWIFLSPIFKQSQFVFEFGPEIRLPWMPSSTAQSPMGGGYASVEKMIVHKDHIELSHGQSQEGHHLVALKTLKTTGIRDFRKEEKALKLLLREIKSDHVIKAIASYQKSHHNSIKVDYCFILPFANNGNLWQFWMRTKPMLDDNFLGWVFQQLSGMMEAIDKMHGLEPENLRHGDLKPENILCFPDGSQAHVSVRLVLTDVGLAKAHEKSTDQRKQARDITSTQVSTVRYQPPELERPPNELRILSRDFDVWSVGCIYMEFIVWLLSGSKKLDDFTRATDQFWQLTSKDGQEVAKLHEEVDKKLWDMAKNDNNCTADRALGRLVDLIRRDFLVIGVRSLMDEEERKISSSTNVSISNSSSSMWKRMTGCFSKKKKHSGSAECIYREAATWPCLVVPCRTSSDEAAMKLRAITDSLIRRPS